MWRHRPLTRWSRIHTSGTRHVCSSAMSGCHQAGTCTPNQTVYLGQHSPQLRALSVPLLVMLAAWGTAGRTARLNIRMSADRQHTNYEAFRRRLATRNGTFCKHAPSTILNEYRVLNCESQRTNLTFQKGPSDLCFVDPISGSVDTDKCLANNQFCLNLCGAQHFLPQIALSSSAWRQYIFTF
jgi:hypothetical protein